MKFSQNRISLYVGLKTALFISALLMLSCPLALKGNRAAQAVGTHRNPDVNFYFATIAPDKMNKSCKLGVSIPFAER